MENLKTEVGTAVEGNGGVSISTSAARHAELSQPVGWAQESTNIERDFSPASK